MEVLLKDERAQTDDAAKAMFLSTPEVQHCYYVTGGVSFLIIIVAADIRRYEALTRRLFAESDNVASYRTMIALDRVKTGTAVVIP